MTMFEVGKNLKGILRRLRVREARSAIGIL